MKAAGSDKDLSRRQFWMIMAGIIVGVVAVVAVVYRHIDMPYEQRADAVATEVNRIINGSITPTGAIKLADPARKRDIQGRGLFEFLGCGPDVNCPYVDVSWFVPIEKGKEQEFIKSIAEKQGYNIVDNVTLCVVLVDQRCDVVAKKDNFVLGATIAFIETDASPTQNVSPKIWRRLRLTLDYYWQNDPQWKK